jgi:hypothetical protein
MKEFMAQVEKDGLTAALQARDQPFDDYRTKNTESED